MLISFMRKFHQGKCKMILNFSIISLLLFFSYRKFNRVQQLICCGGTIDIKNISIRRISHFPLIKKNNKFFGSNLIFSPLFIHPLYK
jgi:hypothetical protein